MKAKRIKIVKGQEVELYLSRTETPTTRCDGKRTGLRATMTFRGPGTICLVTKNTREQETKNDDALSQLR
jgi:hypothetical protein